MQTWNNGQITLLGYEEPGIESRIKKNFNFYGLIEQLADYYGLGEDIMQLLLEYVSKANYDLVRAQYLDPDIMRGCFKCYQTLSRGQHPYGWQVHPGRYYLAVRVPRATSFMGLTQYRDERVIDGQRPERIRPFRNPFGAVTIYGESLHSQVNTYDSDVRSYFSDHLKCDDLDTILRRSVIRGYSKRTKGPKIELILRNPDNTYGLDMLRAW
eukprot:SAG11_NODE_8490_length_1009_cov_2.197802_1_plen_212_part_00